MFIAVLGMNTVNAQIEKGAKMQFYLRVGNVIVAKLLEYFFLGPTITDVGCTFKLLSKKSYDQIKGKLTVIKSELQPEIMVHLINNSNKIIEIPVNYLQRQGKSKITYNFTSSLILSLSECLNCIKLG